MEKIFVEIEVSENIDTEITFGYSGGNCISPPEFEYKCGDFELTFNIHDLLAEHFQSPSVDDCDIEIDNKGNVKIAFHVSDEEPCGGIAGVYERILR